MIDALLARVRALPPMTPAQRETQRLSFAYGNTKIHNPAITRDMVEAAADLLDGIIRSETT